MTTTAREPSAKRDFLSTEDLTVEELDNLFELADRTKRKGPRDLLKGKTLGLLFQDRSLRTRVSFEVAMIQLGGSCIPLSAPSDVYAFEDLPEAVMDGSAEEHVKDAARTLSRYLDGIGIRWATRGDDWKQDRQDRLLQAYAEHASIPVVNLQSHMHHPCQALADVFTMRNRVRSLEGRKLALTWTQNPESQSPGIPHSLVLLASRFGMRISLCHPQGFELDAEVVDRAGEHASASGGRLEVVHDLDAGIDGADFVYARSWRSLACYGDPDREALIKRSLDGWKLTAERVERGAGSWILQPLPVRRNLSVDDEVLDGPRSLVYEQAENRLHTQKALLLHLL